MFSGIPYARNGPPLPQADLSWCLAQGRSLPVPEAWGPWALLSWGVLGNTPSPHLGQALGIQNRPHRIAVGLTNDRSFSSRCPVWYSSPTAHGEAQGGPTIPFLLGHPHPRPPDSGNFPLLPRSQALSGLGFKVFSLQLQIRKPGRKRTLGERVGWPQGPRWGTEASSSPLPPRSLRELQQLWPTLGHFPDRGLTLGAREAVGPVSCL